MLAPWNKSYDKPRQHYKKQKHHFSHKGPSSQSYLFSSSYVWIESWIIKKAEHYWIDAFKLWCWRRLWESLGQGDPTSQSLKKINLEYSLEGLMLKLKLHYFGHLMWRAHLLKRPWCWERLRAGGEGDDRWWDGWMASQTQWTWVWVNSRSWWWTVRPGMLQSIGMQRVGREWATESQQCGNYPLVFTGEKEACKQLGIVKGPWNVEELDQETLAEIFFIIRWDIQIF